MCASPRNECYTFPMSKRKTKTRSFRIAEGTDDTLSKIAEAFGYKYADRGGSVGQLLDAIACGEILLIPSQKKQ